VTLRAGWPSIRLEDPDDRGVRVHEPDRAALEQEALRWLSRIVSGAATDADRDALLRWRAQSSAHEQAFHSALKLWKQIGHAAEARAPAPRRLIDARLGRRQLLKAGALAAGVGGIAFSGAKLGFWPGLGGMLADYRTAAGEQRRVDLTDRVQVELNTRSALSVNAGAAAPAHVTLSDGEAVFTVKGGAERFLVAAANGVMAAERAVFAVRHDDGGVRITCLDGNIDLLEPARLRMRPLEQVVCSGKALGAVGRVDGADTVASWRRGLLVFRDERLDAVVAELNRYRKGLIVVVSRSVAERRVTGFFHLDRLDDALDHIRQVLLVPVHRFSSYFVVLG
jgi:transmembrane sensor